jgi:hypothetical protein
MHSLPRHHESGVAYERCTPDLRRPGHFSALCYWKGASTLPGQTGTSRTSRDAKIIAAMNDWIFHEDDLLAERVSFFLLAQSILVAVAASMLNTLANSSSGRHSPHAEVLAIAIAIDVAGLSFSVVFWYVFRLNYENIGTIMEERNLALDRTYGPDNYYAKVQADRQRRRNTRWYARIVFRGKGMNWIIVNVLPVGFIILWCLIGVITLAAI